YLNGCEGNISAGASARWGASAAERVGECQAGKCSQGGLLSGIGVTADRSIRAPASVGAPSASAVRRRWRHLVSSAAGGSWLDERGDPPAGRKRAAKSSTPTAARRAVCPSSRSAPAREGSD